MRIGLGAEALSPQLTGIGRYTWELANRLPRFSDIRDVKLYRDNSWHNRGEHFLRTVHAPRNFSSRKWREWSGSREFKRRLFHGPNFFFPPQAENAVITVHDLSVFRFPETHPLERIRHFEREFQRSIDNAQHIITDTKFIKQELSDMFAVQPSRISAVPLGVSEEFFETGTAESDAAILREYDLAGRRYCLCVATIEPRKGLAHAVRAFLHHREKSNDDTILVIVGASGWNNSDLHELFESATATGAMKFLGFVSDPALRVIYRSSALFLYPSLYEGFGLPVLEAMASRVPVITSDRSCLPEVSGGVALSVEIEDREAFADIIARALEDDRWRSQAIQDGITLARRLNWQRCAKETIAVYKRLRD